MSITKQLLATSSELIQLTLAAQNHDADAANELSVRLKPLAEEIVENHRKECRMPIEDAVSMTWSLLWESAMEFDLSRSDKFVYFISLRASRRFLHEARKKDKLDFAMKNSDTPIEDMDLRTDGFIEDVESRIDEDILVNSTARLLPAFLAQNEIDFLYAAYETFSSKIDNRTLDAATKLGMSDIEARRLKGRIAYKLSIKNNAAANKLHAMVSCSEKLIFPPVAEIAPELDFRERFELAQKIAAEARYARLAAKHAQSDNTKKRKPITLRPVIKLDPAGPKPSATNRSVPETTTKVDDTSSVAGPDVVDLSKLDDIRKDLSDLLRRLFPATSHPELVLYPDPVSGEYQLVMSAETETAIDVSNTLTKDKAFWNSPSGLAQIRSVIKYLVNAHFPLDIRPTLYLHLDAQTDDYVLTPAFGPSPFLPAETISNLAMPVMLPSVSVSHPAAI